MTRRSLDVLIFETCFQCPMHEKPDAKGLYWNFKCQSTVSIEVTFKTYHINKISVFGSYTVHVLEYYVSYCVKTRIHWGKRQSLVNHMFLLVLMLLALLNNQLYFVILSPTDFATFLFWKVAVPAGLLQNGYREHGKWWLSSKMFAS